MKNDKRADYVTRETIIDLLSDDEVAQVSTAEAAARLVNGEEYLDLEHLNLGVQQAYGTTTSTGNVLPKKSVHGATWTKIAALLQAQPMATKPSKSKDAKREPHPLA
jgi:hypothetical protein